MSNARDISSMKENQVAFAWVKFDGGLAAASMILESYNVNSITDNGVGNYDVNFETAASSADYAALASSDSRVAATQHSIIATGASTTSGGKTNTATYANIRCFNASNSTSSADCMVSVSVFEGQ